MSKLVSSATALRRRAPARVTVPVSRGSLLSGVELETCPLCGAAKAEDRVFLTLRWATQGMAKGHDKQDPEQTVRIRVPTCAACRVDHEKHSRPGTRRFIDVLAAISLVVGMTTLIYVDGVVWQFNAIAIALGVVAPVIARWALKKTGKGRALEVARVKGNRVELEGPESVRQVLADEYPAALNVD